MKFINYRHGNTIKIVPFTAAKGFQVDVVFFADYTLEYSVVLYERFDRGVMINDVPIEKHVVEFYAPVYSMWRDKGIDKNWSGPAIFTRDDFVEYIKTIVSNYYVCYNTTVESITKNRICEECVARYAISKSQGILETLKKNCSVWV